jgi:hypothetical protein
MNQVSHTKYMSIDNINIHGLIVCLMFYGNSLIELIIVIIILATKLV